MKRTFGLFTLISLVLAMPAPVFAQSATPLDANDIVRVTRVDSNGVGTPSGVLIGNLSDGTGIGYGSGGGAVTQGTSRTTPVTINTYSGAITLFTAAGSATAASFTVNNSTVAATDVVEVSVKSSTTNLYEVFVTATGAGTFQITFLTTGGTTSDTPVFNFAVIKAKAS